MSGAGKPSLARRVSGALTSTLVVSGFLGDSYSSLCLIIASAAAVIVLLAALSQGTGAATGDRGADR